VTPANVAAFVATLAENYSRGTLRKQLQTVAMILDHEGVSPNPARHKEVRLPRGDEEEINPPKPRRRVRLRAATTKTRKALWVELHPALAEALEARLGPREDRNPEARLFASSGADALRTSIAKACKAAGIPLFSPHDLRHRRISLLHLRGVPWARIAAFVGQRSLSVTADTYSHVLSDERELDYAAFLNGSE
jgi:integrase